MLLQHPWDFVALLVFFVLLTMLFVFLSCNQATVKAVGRPQPSVMSTLTATPIVRMPVEAPALPPAPVPAPAPVPTVDVDEYRAPAPSLGMYSEAFHETDFEPVAEVVREVRMHRRSSTVPMHAEVELAPELGPTGATATEEVVPMEETLFSAAPFTPFSKDATPCSAPPSALLAPATAEVTGVDSLDTMSYAPVDL